MHLRGGSFELRVVPPRHEFERERQRLTDALQHEIAVDVFVYFRTCSIVDMGKLW